MAPAPGSKPNGGAPGCKPVLPGAAGSPIDRAVPDAKPSESPTPRVPRWRYVVPNAITCTGLLLGLTATFFSMQGDYVEASWLIVLCVLIDKADGTAARLLNATSAIGVQLDSFSDFVTFGIAPGTLMFMTLYSMDNPAFAMWHGPISGWVLLRVLIATYVLCACIRLAKFNVLTEVAGANDVFYGLATTYCGAFVAVSWILCFEYELWGLMRWAPLVAAVLGAAMVSNFPLPKLAKKEAQWLNIVMAANAVMAYICGLFRLYPEYLFAMLLIYVIVGAGWGLVNREALMSKRLDPYPE